MIYQLRKEVEQGKKEKMACEGEVKRLEAMLSMTSKSVRCSEGKGGILGVRDDG